MVVIDLVDDLRGHALFLFVPFRGGLQSHCGTYVLDISEHGFDGALVPCLLPRRGRDPASLQFTNDCKSKENPVMERSNRLPRGRIFSILGQKYP